MELLQQSALSIVDIIMFTLSLFLPFIISNQSEKIKKRKLDTTNLSIILEIILNDITHNLQKLDSSSSILEEFLSIKTKYYGRNIDKSNRLKKYWMDLLINDFKSIRKIDISNVNDIDLDVYMRLHNHNILIEDIKETLKSDNNKLLNFNDVAKLVKLMKSYSKELRTVHSLLLKLIKKLEKEGNILIKTYKVLLFISNLLILILIIFCICILGCYTLFNKNLLSIDLINTIYWALTFISTITVFLIKIIL